MVSSNAGTVSVVSLRSLAAAAPLAAVLVALTASGCGGSDAASTDAAPAPVSAPEAPASTTAPATPPAATGETPPPPAPTTTTSPPSGARVAPAGAPYSYAVPEGFEKVKDVSVQAQTGSATDMSAVGLDAANLIAVSVYKQPSDLDRITDQDLLAEVKKAIVPLLEGASRSVQGPEPTTVAGARAFRFLADGVKSPSGALVTNEIYFLFKGRNEIEVLCQWQPDRVDTIRSGCEDVKASLTVE